MSTEQTLQIFSTSVEQTLQLATEIGRNLRGGEAIELESDLGGGKTAFTKGLARGIGSDELVHSPSFTLSNQYKGQQITIYHFDLYRLQDPGILSNELADSLTDPNGVVVVEWPQSVEEALPHARLKIHISVTGETDRMLTCAYPEQLAYLFDNVTGAEPHADTRN